MIRCPLFTVKDNCLESLPSALIAVTVALKSPMYEVLPEITPELLMLNPLANPLADHEVGFRSAGTCIFTGCPVVMKILLLYE